jgi:hypothetical protein
MVWRSHCFTAAGLRVCDYDKLVLLTRSSAVLAVLGSMPGSCCWAPEEMKNADTDGRGCGR